MPLLSPSLPPASARLHSLVAVTTAVTLSAPSFYQTHYTNAFGSSRIAYRELVCPLTLPCCDSLRGYAQKGAHLHPRHQHQVELHLGLFRNGLRSPFHGSGACSYYDPGKLQTRWILPLAAYRASCPSLRRASLRETFSRTTPSS